MLIDYVICITKMLLNDKEIDIFVASKIGSFKHIKYHTDSTKNNKKCIENLQNIKTLVKEDAITSMVWGNPEQTEILIGRKNQQVQTYDTQQASFTKTLEADFGKGDIVGLGKYKRRVIAALDSGVVKVWSKKKEKEIVLETGGKLDCLRCCAEEPSLFGTGGNENDLKLWRIGETQPVFQAKNLPNDWLQLRQPVWVADLCFLPANGGAVVATCSRYGYVRLYDTRAQRRPVCNVDFKGMAATCMSHSFDDKLVLVGFGRGQLHQVDLRAKGRPDKGYKGSIGAITDIALVDNPRRIVSVSLDRHIKIHDYDTKTLLYKQYLTSKLAGVLVQTETSTPLQDSAAPDVKSEDEIKLKSEDEMDDLFENMDTIEEKSKRKKTDIAEDSDDAKKKKIEEIPDEEDIELAIVDLLKRTEKKKRKMEKKKREKKAKSIYHNA